MQIRRAALGVLFVGLSSFGCTKESNSARSDDGGHGGATNQGGASRTTGGASRTSGGSSTQGGTSSSQGSEQPSEGGTNATSSTGGASTHTSTIDVSTIHTLDEFQAALEQTHCERLYRCTPANGEHEIYPRARWGTPQTCIRALAAWRTQKPLLSTLRTQWEGGLLSLEPERLAQCLALAATCGIANPQWSRACWDALEGTTPLGSNCTTSAQCEGDAYCGPEECTDNGESIYGTCQPRKPVNEICETDDECSAGSAVNAYCDSSTGKCVAVSLGATAALGEACDEGPTASPTIRPCGTQLWCDVNATTPICREPIAVGGVVESDDSPCDGEAIPVSSKCVPYTTVGEGEHCATDYGVCEDTEGNPIAGCDPMQFPRTYCNVADGLTCLDGLCVKVASTGEAGTGCATDMHCKLGLSCLSSTDETCPILYRETTGCQSSDDCNYGDTCISGDCVTRFCCGQRTTTESCVFGTDNPVSGRID